jgi:flavin reductase (DIM6/NTAB) family NADH-FMN oxidoreductase RutF
MSSFEDLRIVDNFYQTSAYFPMPTVCISTMNEDNTVNIGSYSLCFPYYIAGKDYYAMLLECRNNSNTCQNILRTKQCALNFIYDDKKLFKEAVRLGFPQPSADKMPSKVFELEKGLAEGDDRPPVIKQCFQVFECTWDDSLENGGKYSAGEMDGYEPPYNDFNGITSKFGAHFILKIDKILMKSKEYNAIVNGVKAKDFPHAPVDYGYRDSTNFWCSRFSKPYAEGIASPKELDLSSLRFAADRIDPNIHFTDEALTTFSKVPRPFLKTVLNGCADWARENNVTEIGAAEVKIINDKRSAEKNKK